MKRKATKASAHRVSPLDPMAGEEVRARFKTPSLLQLYEDLLKDTEAKRSRLLRAEKKLKSLKGQIKFLRSKYDYFVNDQSNGCYLPILGSLCITSTSGIECSTTPSLYATPNQNSRAKARIKGKISKEKKTAFLEVSAELNQTVILNEAEAEFQVATENQSSRKLPKQYVLKATPGAKSANQLESRSVANGKSTSKKRKISWQEPLALRV